MIIFKNRAKGVYLVTNFKVMYSTLSNQNNLFRVNISNKLLLDLLISWISPRSKFYLIVRNPFSRLESFYKDKFLSAEKNRLWMLANNKGKWQKCTQLFFPYLNMSTDMRPAVVSQTLTSVSFEEVISILPNIVDKDGHIAPQHYAKHITLIKSGFRLRIPIRFAEVYKMENKADLVNIEDTFDINLSQSYNSTKQVVHNIAYNAANVNSIVAIYKKDFEVFRYEQIPPNHRRG